MDLNFTPAERAFETEVRDFVRANLPERVRARVEAGLALGKKDQVAWQQALHRRGWAAPAWPPEHGGPGWTPAQRYLFAKQLGLLGAPPFMAFGIGMVGPVIYTFGTEAQKARYLPPILASTEWWCQGFSEPNAGSDLASLRTAARDAGDHYLVTGQKIWTTKAHYADRMFLLARTGGGSKPQEGISFLLLDMRAPGVTVRPIISIDGSHTLNEVFLDEVRVPKSERVGEEGKGWTYAKFLLAHERTGIAAIGRQWNRMERLRRVIREGQGGPALRDAAFLLRVAELEADLMALEYTELRALSAEIAGHADPTTAPLLKIGGTEIQQRVTALLFEAQGARGAVLEEGGPEVPGGAEGAAADYLYSRASTIFGGTNEVLRNLVSSSVLA
ncbi:acyl-CoA dehydrogenase family protein [Roseomonas chloroacetimidivorans]|uniref:acyl-CoA dehydrogenase family protein n=1 Tax=Roseomonas chloroacetimidivorans TaxID=1766656 RepID=UPI003C78D649